MKSNSMIKKSRMVFQIVTDDKRVFTVHTEVGDGLSRVIVEEEDRHEQDNEDSVDNTGD